jgi:hypothetical protein
MPKAVGVGGVFWKFKEPATLSAWYAEHLGIQPGGGGSLIFEGPESNGMCVLGYFPHDSSYFGGGEQRSMVNFRVDDLDGLLANLATAGVRIDPARENYSYGKFAWIWDPEGNRIELWQPSASEDDDNT